MNYEWVDFTSAIKQRALLDKFESIYNISFPDEDEREPFANIRGRLQSSGAFPYTFIILMMDGDEVIGGTIIDWYPKIESAEIIYICIAPDKRGHGLGEELYQSAVILFTLNVAPPKYIFIECDIPERMSGANNAIDPEARLRFWRGLGYSIVPVTHFQPPLSAEQPWDDKMYLMVNKSGTIPTEDVKNFYSEFYRGLNADSTEMMEKSFDGVGEILDLY